MRQRENRRVYARKFQNEITRAMHAGQERSVWRGRHLQCWEMPALYLGYLYINLWFRPPTERVWTPSTAIFQTLSCFNVSALRLCRSMRRLGCSVDIANSVLQDHQQSTTVQHHHHSSETNIMLLGGSVVRALDSGPIGREFDSRRLRFRVTRSTQPSIPPG